MFAAAAALTAGAATVTDAVGRVHGFRPGVELNRSVREFPAGDEAPGSRAADIAGTYVSGIRQAFTNADLTAYVGEIAARGNDVTIVPDPEVDNGYIIRNFCRALFFNDANPGEVNDIKAVFDESDMVLRINPGQTLFSRNFGAELGMLDVVLMTAGPAAEEGGEEPLDGEDGNEVLGDNVFSPELPVEFDLVYGCLNLKSPVLGFFALVEDELAPSGVGLVGPNMVVNDMIAWISNGEMTYFALPSQTEYLAPVFGLNYDGRCYVYNFAGVDVFHAAVFERRGNTVLSNGSEIAAQVIRDYPAGTGRRTDYYLSAADVDNAYAPVGDGESRFFIRGEVVADDASEFAIELPTCGLYDDKGAYWGVYDGVFISYGLGGSAIDGVTADTDAPDAPVIYYNLQGIRVENPSDGIFIRRQGDRSDKVLVK